MARGTREAGRVSIRVVPDSTGFRRKVKNELDAIEAGLKIKVKAELDTTQLRRELAAATRGQSTKVTLRLDRSAAIREIRELWRVLQAYATANPIRVRLTADTSSLTSAFMAMNRLGSAGGGTQGNRSMITGLANLGRTSARTTLMVTGLAAALTGLTHLALTAGPAVAQLSGVLGVIPAAGLAGVAAVAALALAFKGIADASGEVTAVKAAVTELGPAFAVLQQTVRDNVFRDMAEPLREMGTAWLPVLTAGLGGVGTALGGLARDVMSAVSSQQALIDGADGLAKTRGLFENLRAAVRPLVNAFRDIAAVGADFLPGMGQAVADLSGRFAVFIAQARGTGELTAWIESGIEGFRTLGSVISNTASVLSGLFEASGGGNLLSILDGVTGRLADIVNSTQGQAGLTGLFDGVKTGFDALLSSFSQVAPALLAAVGPALGGAVAALGTQLGVIVQAFAPVVAELAPVLSAAVAAAAPLIAALGEGLAGAINGLLPVLSLVPTVLTLLQPAADALVPVITQLAAVIGGGLAEAIVALLPSIPPMVDAFIAALPAIVDLTKALALIIPPLVEVIAWIAQATVAIVTWAQNAALFIPGATAVREAITIIVTGIMWMRDVWQQSVAVITAVMIAWQATMSTLQAATATFTGTVRTLVQIMASVVTTAIGTLVATVSAHWATFVAAGTTAFNNLRAAASSILGAVVSIASSTASRIVGAFSGLPGALASAGYAAFSGFIAGVRSRAEAVIGEIRALAARIAAAARSALEIRSPSRVFYRIGAATVDGLTLAWQHGRATVEQAVGSLLDMPSAGRYPTAATSSQTATPAAAGVAVTIYGDVGWDPDKVARELNQRRLDALTAAGLA